MENKKYKCAVCKKKLTIMTMFECKCNHILCTQHRYKFSHDCSINVIAEHKNKLEKENPNITVDKVKDRII